MASASSILSKLNPATPNLRGISTNYSNDGQKDIGGVGLGDLFGLTYDRGEIEKIFNQGTDAAYALKQKENQIAQNQYANNQFAQQQSAVESLRQQRNSQIASGMARGLNAAQEQGTILGVQQQGAAGALELANERQVMADEMAAEYAKNVITAMQESNAVKQAMANVSSALYEADMMGYTGELSAVAEKYGADKAYAAQVRAANINAEAQKAIAELQKTTGLDIDELVAGSSSKAALATTLTQNGTEVSDARLDQLWRAKENAAARTIIPGVQDYNGLLRYIDMELAGGALSSSKTKTIAQNMLNDYYQNGRLTKNNWGAYGYNFTDAATQWLPWHWGATYND